jgi:hypothetical protein
VASAGAELEHPCGHQKGASAPAARRTAVRAFVVPARAQVALDPRYQNRELEMLRQLQHDCVIRLLHHFEKP